MATLSAQLATANADLSATRREAEALREALRAAEARERLLTHELQHRVRNMLAVLRSIYRRTREHGASPEEFAEHFEGRLEAIGRYQTDLAGIRADGIELEDMVRDELLGVHCRDGPQCAITGPAIRLQGKSAELMSLALHELATNAIKFGVFRHGGMLNIEWSLAASPERTILDFRWMETGVPLLSAAPRPRGFGRDLIEEALPYQLGAITSFELKRGGIDCSIRLALPPRADHDPTDDTDSFLPVEAE